MMKIYGLKNCDTCRKAIKELETAGLPFDYIDVRADSVPGDQLATWLDEMGADKIVNKRSTTWRNLSEAEKSSIEEGDNVVAQLLDNPTLIKRPVIVSDDQIAIGWNADTRKKIGL